MQSVGSYCDDIQRLPNLHFFTDCGKVQIDSSKHGCYNIETEVLHHDKHGMGPLIWTGFCDYSDQ